MDQYVIQILGAVESLVEHMVREEPEEAQKPELVAVTVPQSVPMPRSILANTEPYMHGDWRKEPYLPRSFLPVGTRSPKPVIYGVYVHEPAR